MYHEHFGLARAPFRITPDTELFYPGGGRGEVLEALVYAVTSGEGIVKVTGEVGTGKTMLCRMLEVRLPASVEVVYIANPSLSPEDILHAIALEMNLPVQGDPGRVQVMHLLQHRLMDKHAEGRRVVVFVEEAQSMPTATLEEIRLLSNLETQRDKLLQIVLFGQPELDEALDRPNIRQLRERITHSFRLEPLSREEVREYVRFRMRAVGYRGPDVFKEGAYRSLARASEGLVRRVNILADKALLAAFADDTHSVARRHMQVAIEDGSFGARPTRRLSWLSAAVLLLALPLAAMFAYQTPLVQGWLPRPEAMVSMPQPRDPAPVPVQVAGPGAAAPSQSPTAAAEVAPSQSPTAAAEVTPASEPSPQPVVVTASDPVVTAAPGSPSSPAVPAPAAIAETVAAPLAAGPAGETSMAAVAATPAGPDMSPVAAREASPADSTGVASAPIGLPDAASPASESPLVSMTAESDDATAVPPSAAAADDGTGVSPSASVEHDAAGDPAGETVVEPVALVTETAVVAPPAPLPPPSSVRDSNPLLADRVRVTTGWLREARRGHFSIQLLLADVGRQDSLEDFLERMQRLGTLGDVYVYETKIGARSWFGVLYRDYASFEEARQALESLPDDLKRHKPFIRNMRDIVGQG